MEHTPVQKVIDSVVQGKYTECAAILAGQRFDKFDVDEWIQLNNTLACEFKLCPGNALAGIKKQFDDLLQQIKGVFLTDELLNLLAVATHNLFYILLMSEFTHTAVVRLYDGCGKGQDCLQETLKCGTFVVCNHYGISVADNGVVSLTNALVEFTNKRSNTEHTGVYLLLYSCAVGYVLSADFKDAQIIINYLREKLRGMNAINLPKAKSTYLLCHSHTTKCISMVLCNLSSELLIITQFLLQEWEGCLQSIGNCEERRQYMHSELQYLKCWLYFKKDNCEECLQYAEVQAKKCILDNSKVAATFFNMVGCCLSYQVKNEMCDKSDGCY